MMGIREYARHRDRLGLPGATPKAIRTAIKDGRLSTSLTPTGKIKSARAADAEWAASTNPEMVPQTGPTAPASGDASGPPVNELAIAKARRAAADAELAEIDLATRRGELVRAADIEARLADVFLRCRTRILGVTTRLREQDPTLTPAQLGLVETLLVEAIEELAGPEAAA